MPRFFIEREQVSDGAVTVDGETARHLLRALRVRLGEELDFCDGLSSYRAKVRSLAKDSLICTILTQEPIREEPRTRVILYQCLPKGDKLEWIIQKTVELGVAGIVPVLSQHSIAKEGAEPARKLARLNAVARAAAEQSRRGMVPLVADFLTLRRAADAAKRLDSAFVLYERENHLDIKTYLEFNKSASIGIFVGAEGGFTPQEAELLAAAGVVPVTLGGRILRTETAAVAALAMLLFHKGEYR